MNLHLGRRRVCGGLAYATIACQWGLFVGTASGALLNFGTRPPDIFSAGIYVEYDATTGRFQANGTALNVDMDRMGPSSIYSIDGGWLSIDVTLDQDTGEVIGGPGITVTGTVADLGFTSNTLLTGSPWLLGFVEPPGGEIFEFKFHLTGGDLDPYFTRNKIGVVLHAESTGFQGDFLSSFNNDLFSHEFPIGFGVGFADTFVATPEPSTGLLLLTALGLVLVGSRLNVRLLPTQFFDGSTLTRRRLRSPEPSNA